MRTKVTLVLLFLNVALFFFIFYVHPKIVQIADQGEARRRVLPSSVSDFKTVEIKTEAAKVRLEHRADGWHLTQPFDWPANPHAVQGMLSQLQLLEHETAFEVEGLEKSKLSLADYGLEKPLIEVTLTPGNSSGQEKAPEKLLLRIGNTTQTGNRLYVLSPDAKRIHVVTRNLADSLALPFADLRSDGVFSIPAFEVRSFGILQPPASRTRLQRESERWYFESPFVGRANSDSVKQTLASLRSLRLSGFVEGEIPQELSPLTSAATRVTLEGNNRSETLEIGGAVPGKPGEFYAALEGRPTVFTLPLPSDLQERLVSAQVLLRERRLLDFEPAALSALTLLAPDRPEIILQKLDSPTGQDAGLWQVIERSANLGPVAMEADKEAVQELLERLTRLSATKFVDDAPSAAAEENWGFNRPERSLVLSLVDARGGTSPSTLKLEIGVGAERGPEAYARLDSARYVYAIDAELLRQCPVDLLAWRNRHLRELPLGASLVGLRLTDLGRDAPALVHVPGSAASKEDPVSKTWLELEACLRSLRAQGFLSNRFQENPLDGSSALNWRYRIDMDIELNAGLAAQRSTQTLFISDRLSAGRQLGGAVDLDVVFLLEQKLIDALWKLTYEAPALPPTQP